MTQEERVSALHERIRSRRRLRERRKTCVLGSISTGLAACLLFLIFGGSAAHSGGTAGMFSGSTMLFDGVGGYVLVAVISFIAAVIITVICIRLQKKHREK